MYVLRLKRTTSSLTAVLFLVAFSAAYALDDKRLWLPGKYRGHYLKLRDAALAVEATERCSEVLRGTLDRDLTTENHPFYRILCRQEDGASYTEVVDGLTMKPRSLQAEEPPPESPRERALRLAREAEEADRAEALKQEQERLLAEKARVEAEEKAKAEAEKRRQAELKAAQQAQQQARKRQHRQQVYEEICRSEILARTSMMMNLEWITNKPIPEELDNGQLRFHVEFDAENMWGKKLEYAAVCTISTPKELVVVITPR